MNVSPLHCTTDVPQTVTRHSLLLCQYWGLRRFCCSVRIGLNEGALLPSRSRPSFGVPHSQVQGNQKGVEIVGTHFLVCVSFLNLLAGNIFFS